MEYFEKPAIDLADKRIVAVFTAYNEIERVAYFLSYYRGMGVGHFLAIDNGSSDGTGDLLKAQPDVTYFHTSSSYVESKAGRLWTSELANHYCVDKWCLTLDLDELLVFPGSDEATLSDLCDYLEEHGYEGIFTVFLDMYSKGSLSDAIYTAGQSFLDVCDQFEPTNYTLTQSMHFPHVGVFGGPRQRVFWGEGKQGRGPSMRKLPLIKWQSGFRYLYSTHSSSPVNLADITGALLHFKFFSSFKSFAEREVARGDRVQVDDYANYARLVQETNLTFRTDQSKHYASSLSLVEHGVMVCTNRYINWLRPRLAVAKGTRIARRYDQALREAAKTAVEGAVLRLSQLPIVWSLLSSANDGGVIAVRDRQILGWFLDRVGRYPTREIEAQVDGAVVAVGTTGLQLGKEAQVDQDHRGNLFAIEVPDAAFAGGDLCRVFLASRRDPVPFASVVMRRTAMLGAGDRFEGSCHFSSDGRLVGWAWSPADPDRGIALTVHLDGKFWCRVVANRFRERLKARGIGNGAHGFSVDLPDWLEADVAHVAHVAIENTNLQLRRSPLEFVPAAIEPADAGAAAGVAVGAAAEAGKSFLPANVVWKDAAGVFLPTSGFRTGSIIGQVLAVRRGVIHGWIADEADWSRTVDVELLVGGRVRRVLAADARIPVMAEVPHRFQNHGFSLPALPAWAPPLQQRAYPVSLRVAGTLVAEEILVAGPRLALHRSAYEGHVDGVSNRMLQGWVWRTGFPDEKIDVAVFAGGRLLARVRAATFREDLREASIGRGYHGFAVPIPRAMREGGEHNIDVVVADEGISLARVPLALKDGAVVPRTLRRTFRPMSLKRIAEVVRSSHV